MPTAHPNFFSVGYHWDNDGGFVFHKCASLEEARRRFEGIPSGASRVILDPEGSAIERFGFDGWDARVVDFLTLCAVAESFGFDAPRALLGATHLTMSLWGRESVAVQDLYGQKYLVKVAIPYYDPSTSIDSACRAVSHPGQTNTRFNPDISGTLYQSYQGVNGTRCCVCCFGERAFVCTKIIPGSSNLAELTSIDRCTKRLMLARAVAWVHSLCEASTLPPAPAWSWIGNPQDRIEKLVHTLRVRDLDAPKTKSVMGFLMESGRCARISQLPLAPGTGDLQTKNIVAFGNHDTPGVDRVAPVNLEILVPILQVWDLAWIILMDDKCSGLSFGNSNDDDDRWIYEFAAAMVVYKIHRGKAFRFTEEEIFLFVNCVQIKMAQVASITNFDDVDTVLQLLEDKREVIRNVMKSVNASSSLSIPYPHPGALDPRTTSETHGLDAIAHKLSEIKGTDPHFRTPIVLFYNGTYNPVHRGHLDSALQAAKECEKALAGEGGRVIGILFSPCHDAIAKRKLGDGSLGILHRLGLLYMAVHSTYAASIGLHQFNPLLFTHEAHTQDTLDDTHLLYPLQTVERTIGRMKNAGLVDRLRFCWVAGSDTSSNWIGTRLLIHPKVCFCVVVRQEHSLPSLEHFSSTDGPGQLRHRIFVATQQEGADGLSSSAIRKAEREGDRRTVREQVGIPSVAGMLFPGGCS